MKLFSNLAVKREQRSTEVQLSLRDPALKGLFSYGSGTTAGVHVSEESALRIGAVYSCVNNISQDISKMPFRVYRDLGAKGREASTAHPLYNLLKRRPNPLMTSLTFRQFMQVNLLLWGNAFAEIDRNGGGQVIAIRPWRPDRVRLQFFNDKLFYYYIDENGSEKQYRQDQVLHLRGLSRDGILGYSVISLQRESMGLCVASQEYRARFFANDARPGGVFEHPGRLSEPAHESLRKDLQQKLGGANQRSFAILEEGMQWKDVGIPPNDAQFIEGWQASKEDIAGIYRMPPYKIGILKPGTVSHASVEQAALDYYQDCLLFWVIAWEQGCDGALFTDAELNQQYYTKLLTDNVLRADSKTRAEVFQIWRRNGVLSADEWRELEDMNPLSDGQGKVYVIESNMQRLDQVGQEPAAPAQPAAGAE